MKKVYPYILFVSSFVSFIFAPIGAYSLEYQGAQSPLQVLGIKEGDIIGSDDIKDPDIFIINEYGFRRLFLNPKIFSLYGHLKYTSVQKLPGDLIAQIPVSGFFRNCEVPDEKVYFLEVTGEDTGRLHWLNISAESALAVYEDFTKRIFCINNNEFDLYELGTPYITIPSNVDYARNTPTPLPIPTILPEEIITFSENTWGTYVNTKYKIGFRYPGSWTNTKFGDEGVLFVDPHKSNQIGVHDLMFSVDENKDNLSPRDFWGKVSYLDKSEDLNIQGYTGLKITGPYGYTLAVNKGGKMLVFSAGSNLGIANFDTILSKLNLSLE